MRGFKVHLGGDAFMVGLQKPLCTQTPLIAGFQSGKSEFWAWGRKVISKILGMGKKFGRHQGANRVASLVGCAAITMAISKEPGHGVIRTGGQGVTKNIQGRGFGWRHA